MKIAAAQIACVVGDITANLRKIRAFAEQARGDGADWVVFPEMCDTGYVMSVIQERASSWDGGAVPELRAIAKELALGLVCGVSEREGSAIFNSQVMVDAGGRVVGRYRKSHLFALAPIDENKCFTAGSELVALPMGEFHAGLSICYDLRFPELYRSLSIEQHAKIFVISSAWPPARVAHMRTLASARAIENQCYLVLSNRVGADNGVKFCGSSMIIDPSGTTMAVAGEEQEELVQAELSASALTDIRQRMPVFTHRRPELYDRVK